MRRALAVLAALAGLGLAAAPGAWSQNQPITFYLGRAQTDTAVGLIPGVTMDVPVRLQNPNYSGNPYWYLTYVRIRVHYDPAKVAVVAALPEPSALTIINSFTSGSGVATVEASGYAYGLDAAGFRLSVQMQSGVTDGAYLWLQPDSVQTYSYASGYAYPPGLSQVAQACHATHLWGDVDANNRVDSRDALITLSAAVGLPVSGFDLSLGDVDGDGLANSRDALMMLSYSIGVSSGISATLNRTGVGIVDACPAHTPPGETLVFARSGTGGGIQRLDSLATAPVQITTGTSDLWPRLNGAGRSVVFQCPDTISGTAVCRVGAAGTGRARLTSVGSAIPFPDWSPNGSRIAFYSGPTSGIATMDSLGAGLSYVPASPLTTAGASWSRDGSSLLYGNGGLWSVLANTPYTISTIIASLDVQPPLRWSPDGQTVAFRRADGRIWAIPAGGGTSPVRVTWFANTVGGFDWGPQGVVFSMADAHGVSSLWLMQGGPGGPLVRLTSPSGQADDQPSFRRNP